MAWRELTVIDQREEFMRLALVPGANKSELCRRFGITHSNGCKWVSRYLAEGRAGLADRFNQHSSYPSDHLIP
jgi:transposase-like protein